SVSAEDAPRLKPYMKLVEYLGGFAGQITRSGIKAVTIEYEGLVADLNTKPLTAIALSGLLRPMLDGVNMVSAPAVAKDRNISLSETKREKCEEYQTLVKLTVTTETQTRSVSGTLFAGKPRLVEVNGIPVEAEFAPHMLFFTNKDKPGLIGKLGTALGLAGVNIATFHLGRNAVGEDAIALVQIDGALKTDVLDSLRLVPNVVRVESLQF
ncbi:MAG: phosphoglycerate dehydrogenase, partial [Rhodospirillaceae bacterium]|nr:phosphoglycerate dehydrogenase [Rhodospirillaceae bacterium]